MMAKSAKGNRTGSQLENTIVSVLSNKGFEVEMYRKWETSPEEYTREILLKNAPFTTIYGHRGNTEFLLISEKYNMRIRIECKWQQVAGSVDEKLPYLYLNAVEAMPEDDIIILIDGEGWKEGAVRWLKNAVEKRLYTEKKKNINIFSLMEFFTWANNTFE